MLRDWVSLHRWGLLTGLGLTVLAVALHVGGLTERLELLAFDFQLRQFSRIPASDRIVHIDIGDDALDRVGSWPWPRDLQAELIGVLKDLGAGRIATDIVWTEPNRAEVRDPALGRYADIEGPVDQIGDLTAENIVFPDDELARAIADAGTVYLSMYYGGVETDQARPSLARRIKPLLREQFTRDTAEIAALLKEDARDVEAVLAGLKRSVAEEKVKRILVTQPAATAQQVHSAILATPFEREDADRADVLAAYYRQLNLQTMREKCPPVPPALRGKLPKVGRVVPPVYKFTHGARRVGFVTFEPDFDGRTRHIPLLLDWDGHLLEQLAFAVVRDEQEIHLEDLSINGAGDLVIAPRGDRPATRVQLDRNGQMLINWHVEGDEWQKCFRHVPVTQLLRITDCRRTMADNRIRARLAMARALHLVKGDAGYEDYRRQVNRMLEQQRAARWAGLQGRGKTPGAMAALAEAERLRGEIDADEKETAEFIRQQWAALSGETNPSDPQLASEHRRFREANRLVAGEIPHIERVNAEIAAQEERWMNELRPVIRGNICFVGYTATAVADMVTTPAYPRMPGVLVHSNVLNGFLQRQFRTWSERWTQAAIIAALGAFVTVITLTRGPRLTLALVLAIIVVSILLSSYGAFERLDHWVRLLTGLILTFVIWAVIVLLRFLTADRQKRQFGKALAQYVSPAVARRIADASTKLDMAPVSGVVSCLFSDLAGFTRMSERLGPEGTRAVLNPYLEAMSAVLHRHNALINKFIGDGIFAFFNPPILACPQHERAACEAALDSQAALRELAVAHAAQAMGEEFGQLKMRIGIASGRVFVGDYGSENKLDYTCVGDTVNLASRLEAANKAFGSRILISGPTREGLGARFVCRRLGLLQVVGQTVAVPVYELLGESGEVDAGEMSYAEAFDEALSAYNRRDWAHSMICFQKCLELRPEDPGASRYLRMTRAYQVQEPPDDWTPTIELTEK